MGKSTRYSRDVRERAVRMVFEHQGEFPSQWSAMESIAEKVGCTPQTLRKWVRKVKHDEGIREGTPTGEGARERVKALEREVRELHRASEILQ